MVIILKSSHDVEAACEHMAAWRDVTARFYRLPTEEKEGKRRFRRLIRDRRRITLSEVWTPTPSLLSECLHVFGVETLTGCVKSVFNPIYVEQESSTSSTVLCNCLTESSYTVKNRVAPRSCTYMSHTSSYEVMFPWHRPRRRFAVFHRRTMTDEGERWKGRVAGEIKQKSSQTQISKPSSSNSRTEEALYQQVN